MRCHKIIPNRDILVHRVGGRAWTRLKTQEYNILELKLVVLVQKAGLVYCAVLRMRFETEAHTRTRMCSAIHSEKFACQLNFLHAIQEITVS